MRTRGLQPDDGAWLRDLVAACRASDTAYAFPAPQDVAALLADDQLPGKGRIWELGGRPAAWCLAQPEFGNLLFDIHPDFRAVAFADDVVSTALALMRELDTSTADTPLESDDGWREPVLRRWGFSDTGEDVIHLCGEIGGRLPPVQLPDGWHVRPLGDDIDGYVALHRAAFGTTYLTRERRATWHDEPGYRPELDLVLTDDSAELVAFCVSWEHAGGRAELGTVGVRPDHRGRGLGHLVVRAALHRLAERAVRSVTMSTSSANAAMLAVARAAGLAEHRRTRWLRRPTAVP
jgi:RimJ/RimL family protein N-acetyltransferase